MPRTKPPEGDAPEGRAAPDVSDDGRDREQLAEEARLRGTVEVDGQVYRYDPATGDVVPAEGYTATPIITIAPPDVDDTADFPA